MRLKKWRFNATHDNGEERNVKEKRASSGWAGSSDKIDRELDLV